MDKLTIFKPLPDGIYYYFDKEQTYHNHGEHPSERKKTLENSLVNIHFDKCPFCGSTIESHYGIYLLDGYGIHWFCNNDGCDWHYSDLEDKPDRKLICEKKNG